MFFKGHANVMNGLINAVGEMDESQKLEDFLRDLSINKNIYTVGLFDCCRRERAGCANTLRGAGHYMTG